VKRKHKTDSTYCVTFRRCPTTDMLDLLFYSSQPLSWAVRFAVPKFQAFDSLYIACSAYVCDSVLETRAHCDRSCEPTTTTATATNTRRRRRVRGPGERDRGQLKTYFTVADHGFGPIIGSDGQLRLIRDTRASVIQSCLFFPLPLDRRAHTHTHTPYTSTSITHILHKQYCRMSRNRNSNFISF